MPVIATYGIAGNDAGILAIAFPGVRVLRGPHFPPFIPDQRLIVFSDDDQFLRYPNKEIIQIRNDADIQLDTKRGFLRFLGKLGLRATDEQVETLLVMDDDRFWYHAKIAKILGSFRHLSISEPARGALYRLYDALFEDFEKVYVEYHWLRHHMSYEHVLSGLMTMVQKGRIAHRLRSITPHYRRLLVKNQKYDALFTRELLEYLGTKKNEWCFLGFLAECSAHTRPAPDWLAKNY